MKAYKVEDIINYEGSLIVFAETRGKAKVIAQCTDEFEDVDFINIRATRKPNFDKYYKPGKVEMNWYDDDDRLALVKAGWSCLYGCDTEDCIAKEFCCNYES